MKNIYNIIIILALGVSVSGCENWFEKQLPPHQLVGDNAITNESTAEVALNGVYSYLDEVPFNAMAIIDNEYRLALFAKGYRQEFEEQLVKGYPSDENAYVLDPWKYAYQSINAANNFIYYTEKLSDDKFGENRKTEMLAEAKFVRAFFHSFLLRKYGFFFDNNSKYGALIRTEPSSLSNNSMPRSTVAESYRQIFEDYDYAITYGPQFYSKTRASVTAAKAFKADLLMSRGEAGDYAEAIILADEVLSDSIHFKLEKDYASVFTNGYESSELLFSRSVDEIPKENENVSTVYRMFCTGKYEPSDLYYEYLPQEDARYAVTFDSIMVKELNRPAVKTLIWNKHYQSNRDCPMYFMRLAQMVLVKAEAMFYTDASIADIVDVLNILRKRSGNVLFDAEDFRDREALQEEIFRENLRELGMENGNLFFVSVRMKFGGVRKVQLLNSNYLTDNLLVFPIPVSEMQNNFEIEQRP